MSATGIGITPDGPRGTVPNERPGIIQCNAAAQDAILKLTPG